MPLPYKVDTKCGAGQYWQAVNVNPAFTPKGLPQSGLIVPPTTQRSIGDLLTANNIPWKYYGNGFNASGTGGLLDSYCNICNPFEYEASYPSMVPDHMRDVTDLFTDLVNGTLPAVSYVKPHGTLMATRLPRSGYSSRPSPRILSSWRKATPSNGPRPRSSSLWTRAAVSMTRASYSQSIFLGQVRAFR